MLGIGTIAPLVHVTLFRTKVKDTVEVKLVKVMN